MASDEEGGDKEDDQPGNYETRTKVYGVVLNLSYSSYFTF